MWVGQRPTEAVLRHPGGTPATPDPDPRTRPNRPLREPAVLQQPVVQHQRAGHRQVERRIESGCGPHGGSAPAGRGTGPTAPAPAHRRRSAGGGTTAGPPRRPAARRPPARSPAAGPGCPGPRKRHSGTCAGVSAVSACRPARASQPGPHGEAERRAERVRGAQQGADIGGFRHALGADAEIAAGGQGASSGFGHGGGLCPPAR